MKTIVINLIGSPGSGKSTVASNLFSKMKWLGYDVELVSEYAKELVWEERHETFKDEVYIFAKQNHRMQRLNGKVKYIITDRPIIISCYYNHLYKSVPEEIFNPLVIQQTNLFNNFNLFLKRGKPYVNKGRNQTEEESDLISKNMLLYLKDLQNINFIIQPNKENVEELIDRIIENLKDHYE